MESARDSVMGPSLWVAALYTDIDLILVTWTCHSGQGLLSYKESSYIAILTLSNSLISSILLCLAKYLSKVILSVITFVIFVLVHLTVDVG